MFKKIIPLGFLLTLQISGCTVNPVTGERNFQIYGSDWEKQVGAQTYAPMKQSQGGDFILDPELTRYVQDVGQRLATQARRKDELKFEFSVLNDSTPNAWALPGGKIVVNRGLLVALNSEAELAAVLGHEIVHADAAHGARAQSKGMLTQVGAIATQVILSSTIDSQAAREVGVLLPAVGAQLLTQKYGRDAERESDQYGMVYMSEAGYPQRRLAERSVCFPPTVPGTRGKQHPDCRKTASGRRDGARGISSQNRFPAAGGARLRCLRRGQRGGQ